MHGKGKVNVRLRRTQLLWYMLYASLGLVQDYRKALGAAMASAVTHVLDFGPGGSDGIGGSALFAAKLTQGTGAAVIVARAAASVRANWR